VADNIHTFNINIHEIIDKQTAESDLGRDALDTIEGIKNRVPEKVNITDPSRSKHIDSLIGEVSKISSELASSLRKEFTEAIKDISKEFSVNLSNVSLDIVSNIKKAPTTAELQSQQMAGMPDVLTNVDKGFNKFKKKLFESLTTTFKLELGDRFKVVGRSFEDAFKTVGNMERLTVVDMGKLKAVLQDLGGTAKGAANDPEVLFNRAIEQIIRVSRPATAPEKGLSIREAEVLYDVIRRKGPIASSPDFFSIKENESRRQFIERMYTSNTAMNDPGVLKALKDFVYKSEVSAKLSNVSQNVDIPRYQVVQGGVPVIQTDTGSFRLVEPRTRFKSGHLMAAEMLGYKGKELGRVKETLLSTDTGDIERLSNNLWNELFKARGGKLAGPIINAAGKVLGKDYSDQALVNEALKTGKDIKRLRDQTLSKIKEDMENMAKPYSEVFHAMSTFEDITVFDEMLSNLTRTGVGRTSPVLRFVQRMGTGDERAPSVFMKDIGRPVTALDQYYPERPLAAVQAHLATSVETDFLTNRYYGRPQPGQEVQEVQAVNYLAAKAAPYAGVKFSTIGTSEGKAASFGMTTDEERLVLNMYRGDAGDYIPFGRLRQEGRVIYPVTQARSFRYIDKQGRVAADVPKVLSENEARVAAYGPYPSRDKGYGINLVTKIVDSAGVFEDQFLISAKVMKGFTTTVKNIIGDLETLQKLKETPGLTGKKAQEIIAESPAMAGVKLNTNADVIAVGAIDRILSSSNDVELATAQIVNTVFSTINTKLSTRPGSKGTVKYVEPEVLGTQVRPLNVQEMMVKLLEKKGASEDVISAATQYGAMPYLRDTDFDRNAKKVHANVRSMVNAALGVELKRGPEVAKQLRDMVEEEFGKEALTVEVPIEAQISLTGLTKRLNVGAEIAEMMAAGVSGGETTIIPRSKFKQTSVLDQINKMGEYLGYVSDVLSSGEKVNFLSKVVTERGSEYSHVGPKFFAVTGDKREQASWRNEDIYQWRRGTNLNPAAVSAYLSRYGVDTSMGQSVLNDFLGKRESKEKAFEYMKMRRIPSGLPQLDLMDLNAILPLEDASKVSGTILDKTIGIHGKVMRVPKVEVDPVTGVPYRVEGNKSVYMPTTAVLDTFTEKKTGKIVPTSITQAYDKLISSTTSYYKHLTSPTSDFEGIDYDFMRTSLRSIIGKRLAKVRETINMIEKASKSDSDEMLQEALEQAKDDIKFIDKLGVDAVKGPGGKLEVAGTGMLWELVQSPKAAKSGGFEDTLDYVLEKIPSLRSTLTGGAIDRKGIKEARKVLANTKDLFIRTNTREDARQISEDARRLSKMMRRNESLENLGLAEPTIEYVAKGLTSDSARKKKYLEYWDKAFKKSYGADWLKDADEEVKNRLKVEAFKAMATGRGSEVPKPLQDQIAYTANKLLGKYKVSSFSGFINEAEDVWVKKAAEQFDIRTTGPGFAEFKDIFNISQALSTIEKKPAEMLLGHKKGVEDIQTRVLPGATGGVMNALIDKRKDFTESISLLYSVGADSAARALEAVKAEHEDVIEAAKARGEIVLTEFEIGVSPKMAGLMRATREKSMKGMPMYTETARFPITGEFSFQPYKARMVDMRSKYMLGREAKAVALPTMAPGINYEQHRLAVSETQRLIDELKAKRASLGESRADDIERAKLTKRINSTIQALTMLEVKFRAAAQNLDFDGDTIFAHAATTKKANEEVKQAMRVFRTGLSGGNVSPIAAMQFAAQRTAFPHKTSLRDVEDLFAKKRNVGSMQEYVRIFGQTYNLEEVGSAPKLQYLQDLYKSKGKVFDPETIITLGGVVGKKAQEKAVEDLIHTEFRTRVREGSILKHLTKPYLGQATETVNVLARLAEGMYGVGNIASPYDESQLLAGTKIGGKGTTGAYGLSRMHGMSAMLFKFINEGMATKHGSTPNYSKLHKAIMEGTIMDELAPGGAFAGMGKLATEHATAVRSNVEALSTKQFETEARRFLGSTYNMLRQAGASRQDITNELVDKLSFKGMFEEMRSAVEHFVASSMDDYSTDPTTALSRAQAKIARDIKVRGENFSLVTMLGSIYPSYQARARSAEKKVGTQAGEEILDRLLEGGDIASILTRTTS